MGVRKLPADYRLSAGQCYELKEELDELATELEAMARKRVAGGPPTERGGPGARLDAPSMLPVSSKPPAVPP